MTGWTTDIIPMPAALLFTTKPRRRPNFKSDTFQLLPTLEQALIDEQNDGRRKDGQTTINMIPVPAALLFTAKSRRTRVGINLVWYIWASADLRTSRLILRI